MYTYFHKYWWILCLCLQRKTRWTWTRSSSHTSASLTLDGPRMGSPASPTATLTALTRTTVTPSDARWLAFDQVSIKHCTFAVEDFRNNNCFWLSVETAAALNSTRRPLIWDLPWVIKLLLQQWLACLNWSSQQWVKMPLTCFWIIHKYTSKLWQSKAYQNAPWM